jgi:glycosyltransferase involved in cell wall biosynthesis
VDGLPNAISAILDWSRPFGPPRDDLAYYWTVVTWWIKFGAAAHGGNPSDFVRVLPASRFVTERTTVILPSGSSIAVPTALAHLNPPPGKDFVAATAHTMAYTVPDYDLYDLVFKDVELVRQVILEFALFAEWIEQYSPKPPSPQLLARYVAELLARRPAGFDVDKVRVDFVRWLAEREGPQGPALQEFEALRRGVLPAAAPQAALARRPAGWRGVDVYGHFSLPIGLGEDARLVAVAFELAGYAVNRIDLDAGPELAAPVTPNGFWAVPAPNLAARAFRLTDAHDAQFKVVATPWELPRTPAALDWIYRGADLVCVYSDFVCDAVPADIRPRVVKLPMAMDVGAIAAAAGSPGKADIFTFVTVFDFWSYMARKGPDRAIAAFRSAFDPAEPVRLVIKAMHGSDRPEQLARLRTLTGDDPRIEIIDEVWPTERVLQLLATAHVFVSLHASEGFGRLLAESMLLDTLVIATDFSGSREFCTAETALCVPYTLVPVGSDYLFGEGQFWAAPDIAAAATAMRRAAAGWGNAELTRMRAQARQLIEHRYSLDAAAAALSRLFPQGA